MSCKQLSGGQAKDVIRLPRQHWHPLPSSRRAEPERLAHDIQAAAQSPVVGALLDAVDALLVVLNAERQIVASNGRGVSVSMQALGQRMGDALDCVVARTSPGGCGTAPACETCGALGAVLESRTRRGSVEAECTIRTGNETPHEFNVRATPVSVEGASFTVVSLRDISSEKRREALERIFFHDVLNTLTGLRGWVQRLGRRGTDPQRAAERLEALSRQVEREIIDHRSLLLAESGELVPRLAPLRVAEVLRDLESVFASHPAARGRVLQVGEVAPELVLETDATLLLRVLVNMVCNALEATPEGGTVQVTCERMLPALGPAGAAPESLRFSVHNEGVILPHVQARIFQRSYTTKAGRGRGLGTYSMKLLGEKSLGGEVSFTSSLAAGTVFSLRLPVVAPLLSAAASTAAAAR